MYIPDNIVNILHKLDCETVARKFGINIVKHQAHCFMHEDKHPSLAFKNNCWKCFACDKGGDAISIIRKSKFPQNPKRSVRFSGKRTKRSVQKRKARNTQKAETKVL